MAENNVMSHPLEAPTLASAYEALEKMYGPHTGDIWRTLLFSSGLTGEETDVGSLSRLIASMLAAQPVTALCARGLALRAAAYQRLSAPQPSADLAVTRASAAGGVG